MVNPAEILALSIVRTLQSAGHIAYLAGGCVRDRLMGLQPKDFDVATSATPEQVLRLYPKAQQVGAAFGVILIRGKASRGESAPHVEVATFRDDGTYSDGRHPDQVRFSTPERDAQRRDFTCNGLFLDPLSNGGQGEIRDFVGGRNDIASKTLRAIGDPAARFAEDHLRMLRAIRFAARLGFTIEGQTFNAIRAHAEKIRTISKERIHDELARILSHPTRGEAADLLQRTCLLRHLWPGDLYPQPEVLRQRTMLEKLPADADFVVALLALYLDIILSDGIVPPLPPRTTSSGAWLSDLLRQAFLLNNVETADLAWLADRQVDFVGWKTRSKPQLKRLLADARWPRLFMLYAALVSSPEDIVAFRAHIAALQAEGVAPTPYITGDTLIQLGARPGPQFKPWLDTLYDRQLNNEFSNKEEAGAAARALLAQHHMPSGRTP